MYKFFEKGTKGGIYYISNRYSKASNKYLKSVCSLKKLKLYLNIHFYACHFVIKFLSNELYTMFTLLFSIDFANAYFLFIGIAKYFVIVPSLAANDSFFFVISSINLINIGE